MNLPIHVRTFYLVWTGRASTGYGFDLGSEGSFASYTAKEQGSRMTFYGVVIGSNFFFRKCWGPLNTVRST
jgi:hypothetical protein